MITSFIIIIIIAIIINSWCIVNAYTGQSSLTYLLSQLSYEDDSIIILILQMSKVRVNQRIKYMLNLANGIAGAQSWDCLALTPISNYSTTHWFCLIIHNWVQIQQSTWVKIHVLHFPMST